MNIDDAPEGVFWVTRGDRPPMRACRSRRSRRHIVAFGQQSNYSHDRPLSDEEATIHDLGYVTDGLGRYRTTASFFTLVDRPAQPDLLPMRSGWPDPALPAHRWARIGPDLRNPHTGERTHLVRYVVHPTVGRFVCFESGHLTGGHDQDPVSVAYARSLGLVDPRIWFVVEDYVSLVEPDGRSVTEQSVDPITDPHRRDVETIGRYLNELAQSEEWCDEFDGIIGGINGHLTVPLPSRHITVRVEYDVTERRTTEVTVTNTTDLERQVRASIPGTYVSHTIEENS